MKKLVAFICTVLLMMAMSMTAFATNPSVSAGGVGGTGNETGTTSPSTGESVMTGAAGVAVIVGALGVTVVSKKRA